MKTWHIAYKHIDDVNNGIDKHQITFSIVYTEFKTVSYIVFLPLSQLKYRFSPSVREIIKISREKIIRKLLTILLFGDVPHSPKSDPAQMLYCEVL